MHFLKEGQKIWAWVDQPPLFRAMPERKRFFPIDVFPYADSCNDLMSIAQKLTVSVKLRNIC